MQRRQQPKHTQVEVKEFRICGTSENSTEVKVEDSVTLCHPCPSHFFKQIPFQNMTMSNINRPQANQDLRPLPPRSIIIRLLT